jgi:16S rRNA (guanine1207-N2)-methyltransferase
MFDGALEHLKSGGTLTVVIRKQQGAESALKFLAKANAEVIERQKGYWVIQARI